MRVPPPVLSVAVPNVKPKGFGEAKPPVVVARAEVALLTDAEAVEGATCNQKD